MHTERCRSVTLFFLFGVNLWRRFLRSRLGLLRGSRFRSRLCSGHGSLGLSCRGFFPLLLSLAGLFSFRRSRSWSFCFSFLAALHGRWWRWRRRRRLERLEEFDRLGARAEFAVEKQHEDVFDELRINRQIGSNAQLRHLRQRDALFHLPPLAEEVLDLVGGSLIPCGGIEKKNCFRLARREQLPCA